MSLQSAAEFVSDMSGGVWFCSLVDLRDPNLVAQQIANSLPVIVADKDPLEAIISEFRSSSTLIIVDNCEHLVKAVAPVIHRLLKECPKIRVIATSREPLAISGEFAYLVPPMEWDLKGEEPTLENVSNLEAVTLLRERAASRLGGKEILTEQSAQVIADLVKRLAGIPLALEQAASNMSVLSPRQILDRLEKHFKMFENDEWDVDERHKTILPDALNGRAGIVRQTFYFRWRRYCWCD
jgi:non-specific serine/threonine protein kinase